MDNKSRNYSDPGWHLKGAIYNECNLSYVYVFSKLVEGFPIAQVPGIQSQVESYQRLKKWYLIPP